jgi:hypothetical protein
MLSVAWDRLFARHSLLTRRSTVLLGVSLPASLAQDSEMDKWTGREDGLSKRSGHITWQGNIVEQQVEIRIVATSAACSRSRVVGQRHSLCGNHSGAS